MDHGGALNQALEVEGDAFVDFLQVGGAQGAQLGLVFGVPSDEGAGCDAGFFGDLEQALVLGAEFDEFVYGFGGVHKIDAIIRIQSYAILGGDD